MRRTLSLLAAAATLWVATPASAARDDPGLYLFRIPVTSASKNASLSDLIEADLEVPDAARLVRRLGDTSVSVVAVQDGVVRIAFGADETFRGEPDSADLAATFVVDYDEEPVAILSDELQVTYGDEPPIDALIEFVDATIATKTYRRSFDLASQVANRLEGDCTEHAVLLAALARALGRPARVVSGIMLVETSGELLAFGHAWAEVYDGAGWRVADATRPERDLADAQTFYLPLNALDNEGPGYALQLAELITIYPARIDRVRSVEAAVSMR